MSRSYYKIWPVHCSLLYIRKGDVLDSSTKTISLSLLKKLGAGEVTLHFFKHVFGKKVPVSEVIQKLREVEHEDLEGLLLAQDLELTTSLIKYGANVNAGRGRAIREASENGRSAVVQLLLEYSANIHVHDDFPLRIAATIGHTNIVRTLLRRGADLHANEDDALRQASWHGHTEVVKVLLRLGADPNAKDGCPLLMASECGHAQVVLALLEHGADIDAYGEEALIAAEERDQEEVVEILKKAISDGGSE